MKFERRAWIRALLLTFSAGIAAPLRAMTLARSGSVMGWDLTYERLIGELKVQPPNFLVVWAQRIRERFTPGLRLVYEGEPVISAFLVEHAVDGHAGDPIGLWAGRTATHAFVQLFALGSRNSPVYLVKAIDVAEFDQIASVLLQWQPTQLPPAPRSLQLESMDVLKYSYVGVVSVFHAGRSRQWPVALSDLYIFSDSKPVREPALGRLNAILEPLTPREETTAPPRDVAAEQAEQLRRVSEVLLSATLEDTDGTPQPMSVYRGKLLVMCFFATWCKYCEDWSRALSRFQDEFRAKGLTVIAFTDEPVDKIIQFRAKHSPKYQLLKSRSADDLFRRAAQIGGLPTTYVIDQSGAAHGPFVGTLRELNVHQLLLQLSG